MSTPVSGVARTAIIAERELRSSRGENALVRLYAPELTPPEARDRLPPFNDQPQWRCGFELRGVPGVQEFFGVELGPNEVYFAPGADSFWALTHAIGAIRFRLEEAEEKYGVQFTWPFSSAKYHDVPKYVFYIDDRNVETRLIKAMWREWDTILAERRAKRRDRFSDSTDEGCTSA